jgi:hypothetical protein
MPGVAGQCLAWHTAEPGSNAPRRSRKSKGPHPRMTPRHRMPGAIRRASSSVACPGRRLIGPRRTTACGPRVPSSADADLNTSVSRDGLTTQPPRHVTLLHDTHHVQWLHPSRKRNLPASLPLRSGPDGMPRPCGQTAIGDVVLRSSRSQTSMCQIFAKPAFPRRGSHTSISPRLKILPGRAI